MNVRVLIALLLISVVLAFRPRTRHVGLALCALWIALLLWVNIREAQLPAEPEPSLPASTSASQSSAPLRVNLVAMQLEGRGAPWHLTATVHNSGDTPLKWLRLRIERYDCPTEDAAWSECSMLWQGEHIARQNIAANATIKLDESFYSHVAVPLNKGVSRDRIAIADAG